MQYSTTSFARGFLPLLQFLFCLCLTGNTMAQSGSAQPMRETVTRWASAWQSQFVEEYLAYYLADYAPPGSNRDQWLALRRKRIEDPEYIRIVLSDFEIVDAGRVRFWLEYQRPGYADRTRKELELRQQDGAWLIATETNLEVQQLAAPP